MIRPEAAMARLRLFILLPLVFHSVASISFFLPIRTRKCLKEEIHKDVLVTGEYEISEQANSKVNLKVGVCGLMLMLTLTTRRRQLNRPDSVTDTLNSFKRGN